MLNRQETKAKGINKNINNDTDTFALKNLLVMLMHIQIFWKSSHGN